MQVKHIVMWRVRSGSERARPENRLMIADAVHGPRSRIPGLLRSRMDYACDVVLCMQFQNAPSLAACATQPDHREVKQALGGIRTERYQLDCALVAKP